MTPKTMVYITDRSITLASHIKWYECYERAKVTDYTIVTATATST